MNKTYLMIFVSLVMALSLTIASPASTYTGRLLFAVLTFVCVWMFLAIVEGFGAWLVSRRNRSNANE